MITQIVAIIAVTGFFGLACFQISLALGFPLGKAAWGGKYRILPTRFRIASLLSAAVFVFTSFIVLERASVFSILNSPMVVTNGVWLFTAFLGLNTLTNFMSSSRLEKRIMTPVALVLALLCLTVAITSG